MNTTKFLELTEQLEDDISDLEDALDPLLTDSLSASTRKLPLLDKAKLYATAVYAIESLLFSYLRLHGVDAKQHAVFRELARVKQYFEKIKEIEAGPPKPRENLSLNKQAAGRMIKHALAGNNKMDLDLAERKAREALLARRKLKALEQKQQTPTGVETPSPQVTNGIKEDGEVSGDNDVDNNELSAQADEVTDPQEPQEVFSTPTSKPRSSEKKRKKGSEKSAKPSPSKKKKRKLEKSAKSSSAASEVQAD